MKRAFLSVLAIAGAACALAVPSFAADAVPTYSCSWVPTTTYYWLDPAVYGSSGGFVSITTWTYVCG